MKGTFRVNGTEREWTFESGAVLLDVLRDNGHSEVRRGCGEGVCGSCSVVLDGSLVNSCQVFAASVQDREILTIAGLGTVHDPHPIQLAFAESGAVQCGFCTPGMILAAWCLLSKNPDPTEDDIARALDGNLCRCTGYVKILKAVRLAAERMRTHG